MAAKSTPPGGGSANTADHNTTYLEVDHLKHQQQMSDEVSSSSSHQGKPAAGTVASKANRWRSEDVQADKTFADLGLPQNIIAALSACGFLRPSPVQQAAIPLGRLGSDLIVQAKSGTGKTVVFSTICLERVKTTENHVQALIVAPTREIAIQTEQVINQLAAAVSNPPTLSCAVFVGGLPIIQDEKRLRRLVHVAVGTPGRLTALIQNESLKCDHISMFILDEADVLLSDSFYADVTGIYDVLPRRKQVMAFSATFTPELLADLEPLMKRPQRVMLCEETVSLKGVRQYYHLVASPGQQTSQTNGTAISNGTANHMENVLLPAATVPGTPALLQTSQTASEGNIWDAKVSALKRLLSSCSFHQASVFCNNKPQAVWLARWLCAVGFPAVYLGADLAQEDRQTMMQNVRAFKTRVVVSTDVLARGVDLERINLVVNMDLPRDASTYVHRVGRTGRFGTRGVAVCMVSQPELDTLKGYLTNIAGGDIEPLPEQLPSDLYAYELSSDWEKQALETLKQAPVIEPPAPLVSKSKKAQQDVAVQEGSTQQPAIQAENPSQTSGEAGRQVENSSWSQAHADAWAAYYASIYGMTQPYSQQGWPSWNGVDASNPWSSYTSQWHDPYAQTAAWYAWHQQQQQPSSTSSQNNNGGWPGPSNLYGSATHQTSSVAAKPTITQQQPTAAAASAVNRMNGHATNVNAYKAADDVATSNTVQDIAPADYSDDEDVPTDDAELDTHAARLLDGLQILDTVAELPPTTANQTMHADSNGVVYDSGSIPGNQQLNTATEHQQQQQPSQPSLEADQRQPPQSQPDFSNPVNVNANQQYYDYWNSYYGYPWHGNPNQPTDLPTAYPPFPPYPSYPSYPGASLGHVWNSPGPASSPAFPGSVPPSYPPPPFPPQYPAVPSPQPYHSPYPPSYSYTYADMYGPSGPNAFSHGYWDRGLQHHHEHHALCARCQRADSAMQYRQWYQQYSAWLTQYGSWHKDFAEWQKSFSAMISK